MYYKYKNYTVEIKGQTIFPNIVTIRVMDMFAPQGRYLTVNKCELVPVK